MHSACYILCASHLQFTSRGDKQSTSGGSRIMFYKEEVFKIEIDLGGGRVFCITPAHNRKKG